MRFEIAEITQQWSLHEAMFKKIRKSELENLDKCQVGELFKEPLQIFTPRNNFRIDRKTGKANDFVQVTIIFLRVTLNFCVILNFLRVILKFCVSS